MVIVKKTSAFVTDISNVNTENEATTQKATIIFKTLNYELKQFFSLIYTFFKTIEFQLLEILQVSRKILNAVNIF